MNSPALHENINYKVPISTQSNSDIVSIYEQIQQPADAETHQFIADKFVDHLSLSLSLSHIYFPHSL